MTKFIKLIWNKFCNREVISYLIFGVLTTIVSYFTFWLFGEGVCHMHYALSNTLSWFCAVIFAFITNKLFVFESKDWNLKLVIKEIITFGSARVFSFLFETGFIALAVEIFHMDEMIAKIIASVFVVIMNYFLSKFWIFKKKEQ